MKNDLFLIDSSVWVDVIEVGRGEEDLRNRVRDLIRLDRVVGTGMVRLEVLRGAASQSQWDEIEDTLSALRQLRVHESQWNEAARLSIQLRQRGVTVPSTDLLIASIAIGSDVVLLHRDRHFDMVAENSSLRVESHVNV